MEAITFSSIEGNESQKKQTIGGGPGLNYSLLSNKDLFIKPEIIWNYCANECSRRFMDTLLIENKLCNGEAHTVDSFAKMLSSFASKAEMSYLQVIQQAYQSAGIPFGVTHYPSRCNYDGNGDIYKITNIDHSVAVSVYDGHTAMDSNFPCNIVDCEQRDAPVSLPLNEDVLKLLDSYRNDFTPSQKVQSVDKERNVAEEKTELEQHTLGESLDVCSLPSLCYVEISSASVGSFEVERDANHFFLFDEVPFSLQENVRENPLHGGVPTETQVVSLDEYVALSRAKQREIEQREIEQREIEQREIEQREIEQREAEQREAEQREAEQRGDLSCASPSRNASLDRVEVTRESVHAFNEATKDTLVPSLVAVDVSNVVLADGLLSIKETTEDELVISETAVLSVALNSTDTDSPSDLDGNVVSTAIEEPIQVLSEETVGSCNDGIALASEPALPLDSIKNEISSTTQLQEWNSPFVSISSGEDVASTTVKDGEREALYPLSIKEWQTVCAALYILRARGINYIGSHSSTSHMDEADDANPALQFLSRLNDFSNLAHWELTVTDLFYPESNGEGVVRESRPQMLSSLNSPDEPVSATGSPSAMSERQSDRNGIRPSQATVNEGASALRKRWMLDADVLLSLQDFITGRASYPTALTYRSGSDVPPSASSKESICTPLDYTDCTYAGNVHSETGNYGLFHDHREEEEWMIEKLLLDTPFVRPKRAKRNLVAPHPISKLHKTHSFAAQEPLTGATSSRVVCSTSPSLIHHDTLLNEARATSSHEKPHPLVRSGRHPPLMGGMRAPLASPSNLSIPKKVLKKKARASSISPSKDSSKLAVPTTNECGLMHANASSGSVESSKDPSSFVFVERDPIHPTQPSNVLKTFLMGAQTIAARSAKRKGAYKTISKHSDTLYQTDGASRVQKKQAGTGTTDKIGWVDEGSHTSTRTARVLTAQQQVASYGPLKWTDSSKQSYSASELSAFSTFVSPSAQKAFGPSQKEKCSKIAYKSVAVSSKKSAPLSVSSQLPMATQPQTNTLQETVRQKQEELEHLASSSRQDSNPFETLQHMSGSRRSSALRLSGEWVSGTVGGPNRPADEIKSADAADQPSPLVGFPPPPTEVSSGFPPVRKLTSSIDVHQTVVEVTPMKALEAERTGSTGGPMPADNVVLDTGKRSCKPWAYKEAAPSQSAMWGEAPRASGYSMQGVSESFQQSDSGVPTASSPSSKYGFKKQPFVLPFRRSVPHIMGSKKFKEAVGAIEPGTKPRAIEILASPHPFKAFAKSAAAIAASPPAKVGLGLAPMDAVSDTGNREKNRPLLSTVFKPYTNPSERNRSEDKVFPWTYSGQQSTDSHRQGPMNRMSDPRKYATAVDLTDRE